ncbi:MAG: DUF2167 domain-containing protein [Acidobacteria bacterium]|nr:DUF2167 domain-containing protein [Acidobacteriota bacterium]
MKKFLISLIFVLSTILTLPDPMVATAQKKEQKPEKGGPAETKEVPREKVESIINELKERDQLASKLKFQQGTITLKDGLATLKLPANFRYLDPDQSDTVLVKLWGNPPSQDKSLGMIFPAEVSVAAEESWGVVITYEEDGYVKDDDAASINYNDLLKEMQEGTREGNAERTKQGYEAIELIGWAAPPRYDKNSHKLYWAKELSFGGTTDHTLNYDIRALGRRGVLSLNAIASMSQLQTIEKDMQQFLSFVEFNEGNRYGDYVAGMDKLAAYGIGTLIAGKLAAKAGLFVLLAKSWKLLLLGVLALGVLIKKLLSGRRKQETAASAAE